MRTTIDFLRALLACFAVAGITGCSTTPKPQVQQPVAPDFGPKGSVPITFTRLVIRVPSGTDLGAHHDGLLKLPQFRHTWTAGMIVGSDEFKVIACEQMRNREYTALGGENLLFGKDDSGKAGFQLGGTLQALRYDTYAPLAGNHSDATVTVEWQMNDALRNEVVFKKTTAGSARVDGIGIQPVKDAFLVALDRLLSEPEFVRIVKSDGKRVEGAGSEPEAAIEIAVQTNREALHLPGDMESIMKSVLLIRAGGTVGSGVIISEDGYALTAAHVVSPLKEVPVRMRSGLELVASVLRVDSEQDLALIKLPGQGHAALPISGEPKAPVGSDLFAVGAPSGEGLAFSVSKGVVSGYREVRGRHYLQTDAALNPGNSGGPLLSSDGRILAIVSWKIVAPGFEGLSFGVPVSTIADRLKIRFR